MRTWIAAAIVLLGAMTPLAAQPYLSGLPQGPFLSIQGKGKAEVAPEIARFTATVTSTGTHLDDLTQKHTQRAKRAKSALDALKKSGLTIESSNFSLNQEHRPLPPDGSQPPKPTYRASTTFQLKMANLNRLNETVSSISKAGLFAIQSISYGIEDEQHALDLARRDAVAKAQHEASVFAEAAGVTLGEVLVIADGLASQIFSPTPVRMEMRSVAGVEVNPPGTIPFRASVTMIWRIKPTKP